MKDWTLHHRFLVTADTIDAVRAGCEPTADAVWVGAKGNPGGAQRLLRHTLRGVPTREIDLAVPGGSPAGPLACEIGRKAGRYDRAERWQVVIREWRAGDTQPLSHGTLRVCREGCVETVHAEGTDVTQLGERVVLSAAWTPRAVTFPAGPAAPPSASHPLGRPARPERTVITSGGTWIESFVALRSTLDGYDLARIVGWHWQRYYLTPLPSRGDMEDCAVEFVLTVEGMGGAGRIGLAEGNRLASRILYAAAVRNGWRKLTARERDRYAFDSYWVLQDCFRRRRADIDGTPLGTATGCGQYTHEAAAGHRMPSPRCGEQIATSHGVVDLDG